MNELASRDTTKSECIWATSRRRSSRVATPARSPTSAERPVDQSSAGATCRKASADSPAPSSRRSWTKTGPPEVSSCHAANRSRHGRQTGAAVPGAVATRTRLGQHSYAASCRINAVPVPAVPGSRQVRRVHARRPAAGAPCRHQAPDRSHHRDRPGHRARPRRVPAPRRGKQDWALAGEDAQQRLMRVRAGPGSPAAEQGTLPVKGNGR
jgi:hypothetical protein